ncbi:MAG: hypothetical protein WKG00_33725 [Polyangiaceae bacterium]
MTLVAGAALLVHCDSDDDGDGSTTTQCPPGTTASATTGNTGGATGSGGSGGTAGSSSGGGGSGAAPTDPLLASVAKRLERGREIFRFDTFGDEAFWGDTLQLHRAISGEANGGVGAGVSPTAALGLGLKVDAEALPAALVADIQAGNVDLEDPKTTLALLELDAVVGVTGVFDANKNLTSMGIQCALCHSTVDDSFAPGIGKRLDGWPNRDLNVGAIISAAPDLSVVTTLLGVDKPTLLAVLAGWGPGKFDAEVFLDGKAVRPDGKTGATLIPAAFGGSGVNLGTYTGWGSTTYWNAFVANLEMHGQGTFHDARLEDATRFPIAAANDFGNVNVKPDLVTSKLGDLHFYQLALEVPVPPADSFDAALAMEGQALFDGKAKCATCHVPPLFTEPGWNVHTPEEIGIDDFQAERSPEGKYRTTPLRGLHARAKGGFYHDGRFETLADVVDHYDAHFATALTADEKTKLVEYLKSL